MRHRRHRRRWPGKPLGKLPAAVVPLLAALLAGMAAGGTADAAPATAPRHAGRATAAGTARTAGLSPAARAAAARRNAKPDCADAARLMCTEVSDYRDAFHYYVGHDEPSVLYYSNAPGSGNQMRYNLTLPSGPGPAPVPGRSWTFQLTPAIWFGMAVCDTQSYPEQVRHCAPDSNANITPLARHPGSAYMELQFYPPGWVKQFNGQSCDPRDWCAALTIDSLSEDPVNGTTLNSACQGRLLGGIEYVNFAFITRSGKPQGPPNPLQFGPGTSGSPDPAEDLFMRPGDSIGVTLHDTAHGLRAVLADHSTGQAGSMTASAANGFGQISYAPTGSSCTEKPYDFHPMYATSNPRTRVPWAAHSYNVAYDEEIGHFDYCTAPGPPAGNCTGLEGAPGDREPTDADDTGCFTAAQSLLVPVSGCTGTNVPGFDGASYQRDWPDGNTFLHPAPGLFTSPLTGHAYHRGYSVAALETDTPRIEAPGLGGKCDVSSGAGCTLVPPADDGQPASFYPFFSVTRSGRTGCRWFLGDRVPGLTASDFGGVTQYGALYPQRYLVFGGHGAVTTRYNDYHRNLRGNPCPAW